MHVHTFGEAGNPTLLALHGTPTTAESLEPLLGELADAGWRVLAPDLPGLGASAHETPRSVEAVHDALVELLRREQTRSPALLGHSFGAWRAFDLALDARLQVRAVVGLGPLARVDAVMRESLEGAASGLRDGSLSPGAVAERWLSPAARDGRPELRARIIGWLRALDTDHAAQDLELAVRARDLTPELPALTMPVYLRVGSEDQATPPAWAREIASVLPDVWIDVMEGVGHFPQLEESHATCDGVRAFLERVVSG